MSHPTENARIRRLRRQFARDGYAIRKIRVTSPHYREYGPFSVVDAFHNRMVHSGLDLEELERLAADR